MAQTVTPDGTVASSPNDTPHVTICPRYCASMIRMAKHPNGRHYIKEWRKKRGLSLRRLEARLEVEPGGEPALSYVSLSRIEKGEQPFDEQSLQAIADALDVTRSMLLEINPEVEGEVIDLVRRMDEKTRKQAIVILSAMSKSA